MKIIHGNRVGNLGKLAIGCSAIIFDATRPSILLTGSRDNECWCLLSGQMEAGESVTEACLREVWGKTGFHGHVDRLHGIYSSPHRLCEYADANRYKFVFLNFEVEPIAGSLTLSDETTEIGSFAQDQLTHMDIVEHHIERLVDAFAETREVVF